MKNTTIGRKCRTCGYFQQTSSRKIGWCHWKGMWRKAVNEECEDGYKDKEE